MLRVSALAITLASGLMASMGANSASNDGRSKDFVILNDDGYGTSDCLAKGSACGKIVADAWCESKGFAKSVAYRAVDPSDITHSTSAMSKRAAADAFLISCTE